MEEHYRKPEIRYSDPVKEIMGKPPRRILRWGTAAIFVVIVIFFVFAWFLKYPDLIVSPVEITTENPPVILVSKISGKIKLINVKDNDTVHAGQLLAVMETTVPVDQFNALKHFADSVSQPELLSFNDIPDLSGLGPLQSYYATFRKVLSDYNNFLTNDLYGSRIKSLTEELNNLRDYIDQLRENVQWETRSLEISTSMHERDLKTSDVAAAVELERSEQQLIDKQIALGSKRSDIIEKEIAYNNKEQELTENKINREEEKNRRIALVEESFSNLQAQIQLWENEYLLISSIDGIVTYIGFWSENQTVKEGDEVLAVVPLNQGKYIGRLQLKMQRSGKVDTGCLVNIKLSSFPYLEYGMVRGVVNKKSLVTSGDAYIIEVVLPNGLKTLYNINLELRFAQNMKGTAEIITNDKRLLEKILYPFRYLYTKNRR